MTSAAVSATYVRHTQKHQCLDDDDCDDDDDGGGGCGGGGCCRDAGNMKIVHASYT